MKCKTSLKHLLITRRNGQKEEDFVRKALQTIFQMQCYGMCGFSIVAYEMHKRCDTVAKNTRRNGQKEEDFVRKALQTIFQMQTECAAFQSWPMKCTNAVTQLLNSRRHG